MKRNYEVAESAEREGNNLEVKRKGRSCVLQGNPNLSESEIAEILGSSSTYIKLTLHSGMLTARSPPSTSMR